MNKEILTALILPAAGIAASLLSWGVISAVLTLAGKRRDSDSDRSDETVGAGSSGTSSPAYQATLKTKGAMAAVMATPLACIITYGALIPTQVIDGGNHAVAAFAVSSLGMWGIAFYRWRLATSRQKQIQWHQQARESVDQMVRPLIKRGYHVFSDLHIDDMATDYLIVGPKGIFTLQVLVHGEDAAIKGEVEPTVTYDGRTLFFPQGNKDYECIEAATQQAERLSEWLSERLASPVAARAILALPGWQIKRVSAEGISVINPSQLEALFQYIKPRPLDKTEVGAIVSRIAKYHDASPGGQNINSLPEITF